VVGLLIIAVFVMVELRTESPLIAIRIFRIRPFFVENVVLMIAMMAFIPMFFSSSSSGSSLRRRWVAESSTGKGQHEPWSSELQLPLWASVSGRRRSQP
jgi:hypothetical protein